MVTKLKELRSNHEDMDWLPLAH